jgi:hypothetical protein
MIGVSASGIGSGATSIGQQQAHHLKAILGAAKANIMADKDNFGIRPMSNANQMSNPFQSNSQVPLA